MAIRPFYRTAAFWKKVFLFIKAHACDWAFLFQSAEPGHSWLVVPCVFCDQCQRAAILSDPSHSNGEGERSKRKEGKEQAVKIEKRPVGRPKGSKNKKGEEPMLSPELLRIQPVLQAFIAILRGALAVQYLVMDGHSDAALYEPFTGKYWDVALAPSMVTKLMSSR